MIPKQQKAEKHRFDHQLVVRLKPLYELDNYHGVIALIKDHCIISIAISASLYSFHNTLWYFSIPVYLLSIFIIGTRQRGLATLLHESAHGILAKSKQLNYWLGTYASGYLIFQMFEPYRISHCRDHHGFLGQQHKDPDLIYYHSQGLFHYKNLNSFMKSYLLPNFLFLKIFDNIHYLIKNRLVPNDNTKSKKEYYYFILYWISIIFIFIYFNIFHYLILFWIIPWLTFFQSINALIEVTEHYPIIRDGKKDLYMTRNRKCNWLERQLFGLHGESFHLLHHLFASIPFWNLPKAHQILLQDPEYHQVDRLASGILTRGKVSQKTIIGAFFDGNAQPEKAEQYS